MEIIKKLCRTKKKNKVNSLKTSLVSLAEYFNPFNQELFKSH